MSYLIELNEGTAARRRVPCRIFTSNGTTPDTGATGDAVIIAINSATTISATSTLRAMESAQGMYWLELTQSECSVLGTHALYHTVGDFPQHIATIQVVNSNPFSTQSNVTAVTVLAGDYSSGVTFGAGTFKPGTYSTVTFSGDHVADVLNPVTIANGEYSAVTVRLGLINYSGATVGVGNIAPATYSGVTVGINNASGNVSSRFTVGVDNIAPATYSDVTLTGVSRLASGAIQAAAFGAGAVDAAALATDAVNEIADGLLDRNMATGTDSGTSAVRTPRDALRALRNRVASDATQLYVYKEDDVTVKWTASITTAASTVNHITGADPNS